METIKMMKAVAKIGKKTALEVSRCPCTFFFHQPRVPAKLLEVNKGK